MQLPPAHRNRLVTAVVLLVVLALGIFLGGWLLRLMILAISSLALYEFLSLFWPEGRHNGRKIFCLALGALPVVFQAGGPLMAATGFALCYLAVGIAFLAEYGGGNSEARLDDNAPLVFGLAYVPFALHLALYLSPPEQAIVILATVVSDTGAYYAGSLLGRHKLWPAVSPAKSWEGLFGGMALCIAVTTLLGFLGNKQGWPIPVLPIWGWAVSGFLLNLASVTGDLFESALKRSQKVKDSGSLLPGHGGVLDRVDSLLFVLPVYALIRLVCGL